MNAQTDPIHVLAVSPVEADLVILSNLIGHSAWTLHSSSTAKAAEAILRNEEVQVVLCDAHLPDADWKKFLDIRSGYPNPPEVIVLSRVADERLWAEVLNLGAWDVLVKPFRAKDVYRAVHAAWRHWTDQNRNRKKVGSETHSERMLAVSGAR